jgi:hypothetical protein
MPGYKRNFKRRVLGVLRSDQETKRVIQTRQNYFSNISPDQFTVIGQNSSGDAEWNKYIWSIYHNTPKFFPVDLVGCTRGLMSGYGVGINHAGGSDQQDSCRIGSELWCKGISLDFMVHLMKEIPYAKLHVSLLRYAKDDFPNKSKLYKGYTGITELDMRDTRRFKTLKTWNYYIKQVQPTTAGGEVDTTGTGVIGEDMNTDAYAGDKLLKVLQYTTPKSLAEWITVLQEEYPDYRMATKGDVSMSSTTFQELLFKAGYNEEADTIMARYSDVELLDATNPAQNYKVNKETTGTNYYSWVSKWDGGTWLTYDQQQASGVKAHQVVIVPKVGMAAPAEGQILVPSNKKLSMWIPGRLLHPGGYIKYKEVVNDNNPEVDAMYDHCLMFQTYLNYQTWDSTTIAGGTATVRPEILRVVDFLNVMYFKDS